MAYFVRTYDPAADWDAYQEALEEENQRFIEEAPKCECCGKSVAEADMDDCYYLFGSYFCVDCVEKSRIEIPESW